MTRSIPENAARIDAAVLDPVRGMARTVCHCGCGCWFYQRRKPGRRILYVNPTHYRREKWRREKARALSSSASRSEGEGA